METAAIAPPAQSARHLRMLANAAIFGAAWLIGNAIVASGEESLEVFFLYIFAFTPAFCVVLLIHGGWRVVPATLGASGAIIAIAAGVTWLDGTPLDSRDIWPLLCSGASFGLPAGSYFLSRSAGHGRAWHLVSRALWYTGLITAGMMASILSHGISDFLVRHHWL